MSDTTTPRPIDPAVNSAMNGDQMSGFEGIYKKYYDRVYRICLKIMGNAEDAEDMTQNVFIKLQRSIGSFKGKAAFTTWLHRVVINEVLMHFRKSSFRNEKVGITEDVTEIDTNGSTLIDKAKQASNRFVDELISATNRIALEKAVAELAPGYTRVFILHDVEGYEHTEIAKIMGISVGTSKSQLHKARYKLRKLLRQKI